MSGNVPFPGSPARRMAGRLAVTLVLAMLVAGCGDEGPLSSNGGRHGDVTLDPACRITPPPAGTVTASLGTESITFWPWTGGSFDGTPSDPVNILFAGPADPVSLRQALLNLDGDRTAYGFPDAYPFNARWTDAAGDIQVSWEEETGWLGSVVQLALGDYEPVRIHLRLFSTEDRLAGGGRWTIGAAHFEMMIPGTADHQVLSWELAQQVVMVDFLRSGLLDPATPMVPTGLINDAPSFRTIPAVIYNLLPSDLVAAIGGPSQPAGADVPIASDGQGMILHVATRTPVVAGVTNWNHRFQYSQMVPRPFCSSGPDDYVWVEGPVDFSKTVTVDRSGRLVARARYDGTLTITPMDVTQNPPVPLSAPFTARVGELQSARLSCFGFDAVMDTGKRTHPPGGDEFQQLHLQVRSDGRNEYRNHTKCQAS